jgi:pimeloyl-ACP methyl ester carboxylesterase
VKAHNWIAALSVIFALLPAASRAQQAAAPAKPSIVLVHGAFADASGWGRVILGLEKQGYTVTAVQNPMTSYADDVATTKRVIDAQPGDVVVVAHSYGGAVITGAASGSTKVKALVYVAAFAPDTGEILGELVDKLGPAELNSNLRPDAAGFLYIDRAKFHELFCADLPADESAVLAATQKPIHGSAFGASVDAAAWKTIPSWFMIAAQDRIINPELERLFAKRMNATTTEIKSSHVAFISHSDEVVKMIVAAATAKAK